MLRYSTRGVIDLIILLRRHCRNWMRPPICGRCIIYLKNTGINIKHCIVYTISSKKTPPSSAELQPISFFQSSFHLSHLLTEFLILRTCTLPLGHCFTVLLHLVCLHISIFTSLSLFFQHVCLRGNRVGLENRFGDWNRV